MANGKLSEQLSSTTTSEIPSRTKRRILKSQATQQEKNFQDLKDKATQLQQTEFSNITTVEQYQEKYNKLSPDLKQFFLTPSEVSQKLEQSRSPELQQRITEVENRKSTLKSEIDDYSKQIDNLNEQRAKLPKGSEGKDQRGQIDSRIDSLVKARNVVATEYDQLRFKEDILKNSTTSEEASQRLSLYQRQVQQESIRQSEEKRTLEQQRVLKEAEQKGYEFVKIEESKNGKPQVRKIYAVTPEGQYKLVSESQARNVSDLQPSRIPKANITEVVRIGNSEITFEGVQNLYKTPEGKVGTAYGTLNISEDKFVQAQEEARQKEAQKILDEKNFQPVINQENQNESIFSKIYKYARAFYVSTPFGITSPVEKEGEVKRQFFSISTGSPIGIGLPVQVNFATLDYKDALSLVESSDKQSAQAQQQIKAIEDLNTIVEQTPDELKADVQQAGLNKLQSLGINYNVNTDTGDITFSSQALNPRKSFAGIRLQESSGIEKVGVASAIVGIKAAEFFIGGEVLGYAFRGGSALYTTLKGSTAGLRISEVAFEGGEAVGTAELTGSNTGRILTKIGKTTVYTGALGLYGLGKYQEYYNYQDIYGEKTGKELFILETTGEIAGFGLLTGKNFLENKEIKKLNEQINLENYQREVKFKRLENIQNYGQFSTRARVEFVETGTGKTVLTKGEKEILSGIYAQESGLSKAEAQKLIQEGAIFEQKLIVESPAGFETFTSSRTGVVSSLKTDEGLREVGIDFTRRGSKVSNVVIKSTTGTGKYSLTSVFERTRRSNVLREIIQKGDLTFIKETASQPRFRLSEVIISKGLNEKVVNLGEIKISESEIESRLVKSFPKSIKGRTTLRESIELGLPQYSEKQLQKIYEDASFLARTTPQPAKILRIEGKLYKNNGIIQVAKEGEFQFAQFGRAGRTKPFVKNIFKDIDFNRVEQLIKRSRPPKTPLSKTFQEIPLPKEELKQEIIKKLESATEQEFKSQPSISPTIAKTNIQLREFSPKELGSLEKLSPKTIVSVKESIKQLIGVSSQNKIKQETRIRQRSNQILRTETIQQEILKQQQRQIISQRQVSEARLITNLRISNAPVIPAVTSTPPRRPLPSSAALPFGNTEKRIKRIIRLKKILKQDEFALFPSFTAKALGIPPLVVKTPQEAIREIKKIQTGFDIRRGIRIVR